MSTRSTRSTRVVLCSVLFILQAIVTSCLNAEDQPSPTPPPTPVHSTTGTPVSDQVILLKKRLDALEQRYNAQQSQSQDPNKPGKETAAAKPSPDSSDTLEARVWKLEAEAETDNGFSFGGNGDASLVLQKGMGYTASADFNPIFLYSYRNSILFSAEINASQDGVALGQAWVAYTALEHLVVEAGLFPIPFGAYSERFSPTWINKFSTLKPSPYNEDYGVFSGDQTIDGVQARGETNLGTNLKLTYHFFVADPPVYNGPDNADPDNRLSFGGLNSTHVPPTIGMRIGLLPSPTAEIGVSAMAGYIIDNQTVDPTIDINARRTFAALAIDGQYQLQRFVLRGEYVCLQEHEPNGEHQVSQGIYLQASRRLDDISGFWGGFEPTVRVGRIQRRGSENGFTTVSECGLGVNYYITTFIRISLLAIATNVVGEDQVSFNNTFTF